MRERSVAYALAIERGDELPRLADQGPDVRGRCWSFANNHATWIGFCFEEKPPWPIRWTLPNSSPWYFPLPRYSMLKEMLFQP